MVQVRRGYPARPCKTPEMSDWQPIYRFSRQRYAGSPGIRERQAAWMGYSALMWGIEVGCVRSPYEANPGDSPDVENTAQPWVRRLSALLATKKVTVGYRPSVATVG